MNTKVLTLRQDKCWDEIVSQELADDEKMIFSVCNLNECPEDAIIGRDLFDAYDYMRAIKYGIELAKQGYDNVDYIVGKE